LGTRPAEPGAEAAAKQATAQAAASMVRR
jgi:hypothetical protein